MLHATSILHPSPHPQTADGRPRTPTTRPGTASTNGRPGTASTNGRPGTASTGRPGTASSRCSRPSTASSGSSETSYSASTFLCHVQVELWFAVSKRVIIVEPTLNTLMNVLFLEYSPLTSPQPSSSPACTQLQVSTVDKIVLG